MVHKILTRDSLFEHIIAKYCNSSPENKARFESGEKIIVGMCGYPNVGQFSFCGGTAVTMRRDDISSLAR